MSLSRFKSNVSKEKRTRCYSFQERFRLHANVTAESAGTLRRVSPFRMDPFTATFSPQPPCVLVIDTCDHFFFFLPRSRCPSFFFIRKNTAKLMKTFSRDDFFAPFSIPRPPGGRTLRQHLRPVPGNVSFPGPSFFPSRARGSRGCTPPYLPRSPPRSARPSPGQHVLTGCQSACFFPHTLTAFMA